MARQRLRKGETIDGFLLGERIHQGTRAEVWECSRPGAPLPLLMKVPKLDEGEDPAAIVGFEMEQMILPRLSGPHVPRFVAAGDFSVQPYLVLERIEGTSLLQKLAHLPLPIAEVAEIGAKVALALDDLHRQHVVHLDVKPSNVMVRTTGEAVLIDFGLSRHADLPDLMAEDFRLPYGTGPYMAPEQILGHRTDPRSDLFALGVLLYFFATGTRPFGEPQRLSGLKRRLWRDPEPPRALRRDLPPWLQEVILRCLEVNPAWRYPSASQLAFDLRNQDQVKLTGRSEKLRRDPFTTALRRRFSEETAREVASATTSSQGASAPIVAVAIDLSETADALAEALRVNVAQILRTLPGARLACLNVLGWSAGSEEALGSADQVRNRYLQRLVELRHWAEPLKLEEGRVTCHVIEAAQAAEAILGYLRANQVDHVVMGARANSAKRALLGSVSAEVASNAPCTVTVVRARAAASAGAGG